MLKPRSQRQDGTTLIEVLVSMLILTFGLLGMAGLQTRAQAVEFEAYQRAQAVLAVAGMTERISGNRSQAAQYVSATTVGAGDFQPATCAQLTDTVKRDLCEWSHELKGSSENLAAATGARGCITQIQAPVTSDGTCKAAVYLVTVAWQGMSRSAIPSLSCGAGMFGADDAYRRAISAEVSVGVPAC